MTEETDETMNSLDLDTGIPMDNMSDIDAILGPDNDLDGSRCNSFLDGFQSHESFFADQSQPLQLPTLSQLNGSSLQSSKDNFPNLPITHSPSIVPSVESSPTVNEDGLVNSLLVGNTSAMSQQRSNTSQNTLSYSTTVDLAAASMSSSSGQALTTLPNSAISDSNERSLGLAEKDDPRRRSLKRRITITLEHADPRTLVSVLDAALKSEAKVKFETEDLET